MDLIGWVIVGEFIFILLAYKIDCSLQEILAELKKWGAIHKEE